MNEALRKIREGDFRTLARVATGIENRDPSALALLDELAPFAGRARVIGVTGPPGAGKSTLADAMTSELRRLGKTVAIVAVDPTSRVTGGAILGDRIRMQRHHADPGVFVRSIATRGASGGIARATADLVRLMDGAGLDYVIIETVGVGQDEIAVASLAQVTIVVLVPGMGDDVQASKAGVLEIADVFAINKSDLPGADKIERDLHSEWPDVPIVRTVATEGTGAAELIERVSKPGKRKRAIVSRQGVAIDHLGIAVEKLDQAVGFYESLGLAVTHRETVSSEQVHVAMMPAGDSRIELLEPAGASSPISKFLEKRGPGLHHVALRIPDLAAAVARLKDAGARVLNEPRAGAGGHLYVFVHPASAGGVLLELIQEAES
jgi:LAO/AO transport system kinase